MVYLKHNADEATTLKSAQILGQLSPLEFDEYGYAELEDEDLAERVVGQHRRISLARSHPNDSADSDTESEPSEETESSSSDAATAAAAFDAEAFVDRTPMDDVVADIESGDYDEHLDVIAETEAAGRDRDGIAEAVDEARGE